MKKMNTAFIKWGELNNSKGKTFFSPFKYFGALAFLLCFSGTLLALPPALFRSSLVEEPLYPLKPVYKGEDASTYYVRQIGSNVYWFGEKADGGFANVFQGIRTGNQVSGTWADVPKGLTHSNGLLTFKIQSDSKLTRISATGGFGEATWVPTIAPSSPPLARAAAYSASTADNLDGAWRGNDNGTYYVNQFGDKVFWIGEMNVTSGRPNWTNIAYGTRVGNVVTLKWVDVPKGTLSSGSGDLVIKVSNATNFYRSSSSGGFGGSKWTR